MSDRIIYDLITKKSIIIKPKGLKSTCKMLGFHYTSLSHLFNDSNKNKSIRNRYIREDAKKDIFTLVDIDTGEEFDCINPRTLCLHLKINKVSENDNKYIYELKSRRQNIATIYGRSFFLKGFKPKRLRGRNKKDKTSPALILMRKEHKLFNKIAQNLRARVRGALYSQFASKSNKTMDLIGCSPRFLREYLESKFKDNMSWDNYGRNRDQWQIDHIEPCKSFDLTIEENQKKCFHYTNLQPLWFDEHLIKSFEDNKKYKIPTETSSIDPILS